jgi:hypothetical protein
MRREKIIKFDDAEPRSDIFYGAAVSSDLTANTQFSKYHNKKGGHGFAAEDANALNDRLRGRRVEKVGLSNAKNGPDRIVGGQAIQTKYLGELQLSEID